MSTTSNNWIQVIQAINRGETPSQELLAKLSVDERVLIESLQEDGLIAGANNLVDELNENKAWLNIYSQLEVQTVKLFPKIIKYAAAVILPLLLIGGGIFYYSNNNKPVALEFAKIIPTEHNRATLVLADGNKIDLAETASQQLKSIAGTSIINKNKSLLTYRENGKVSDVAQVFNKLIIPRGAEYNLALADGTKITVNASSVIRFPVNMNVGNTREVYLESGEAYFEVAKNPNKPFIVHANGMEVRVLGTTFNVNTYTKNTKTTLVEGSVEAKDITNQKIILKPNQQALFNTQTNVLSKADVDVMPYIAWAKGKIVFEEATLDEVMQSLSLWYDYDVEFEAENIKNIHFSGEIEKYKDIKSILNIIEQTGGVKFSIKNRRIYVDNR